MSRGLREQHERRYHVTSNRTHPKGFTEYKVTAEFISKKNPQDVKEVVVWKRYSDFKKLHGELSYTHRNLFQRTDEFPPFPRAQVFAAVIEERRNAAENMLRFTVSIPALSNSPQLKEFFRGGEVVTRSNTPDSADVLVLPPPLTPEPASRPSLEINEGVTDRVEVPESQEVIGLIEDTAAADDLSALDLLFDLNEEQGLGEEDGGAQRPLPCAPRQPLTLNDLALFDPCFSEDGVPVESEADLGLLSLVGEGEGLTSDPPQDTGGGGAYLELATEEIQRAMERETAGDYPEAFRLYRNAVDTLLRGVKDDPCAVRRDGVTRRTAEYLRHAERIFQEHVTGSTA
ncbi:sorting nexin-15 isoform X2 [Ascaphus truei]|uniref:sorting nexin-15 isoform X2 n=1 Tax=Ascaphus truei TaxID=8439 RepID=UPI003F59458F